VTTRSDRSTGALATPRQAREIATSAASGRSLIEADHAMALTLDPLRNAVAHNVFA